MTRRRVHPRLELLEGRDIPGILTFTYAATTHSLTVVGDSANHQLSIDGPSGCVGGCGAGRAAWLHITSDSAASEAIPHPVRSP